ncbi:D-xylulose kinase A [Ophiocordyceps camponoti-floridani]|uniref:Xylulose kinase n=1 Tax=Ophiocordyceps camponoti-floridani TaxID=2030778 RepID=A0A8H4Q9L6_9HYPO|nr:D-xylulose kinase A [Ophiocordyceps camponoti-floridani]
MTPSLTDTAIPLYLGLDLSTQQLKAVVVTSKLETVAQAKVDFDHDLGSRYDVRAGVIVRGDEVTAPVAMWLEALDLVLARLADVVDLARLRAVSGAGQQHGSVFWNAEAERLLGSLDARRPLVDQLPEALAHPSSPNWQDQSTQTECDGLDDLLGGRQRLAEVTGSGAHHRFTGAQIMRLRRLLPDMLATTSRISLVSSWLASIFLGAVAPIDMADVCGLNLWDMAEQRYSQELLALVAGGRDAADRLRRMLGEPVRDGGVSLGTVSPYFVSRYGFGRDCRVVPFTGDNPATMLALPLRPLDAIVSLGTSTTFLMNTPVFSPDESYHFFHHPTTPGHYMFMLCYKNGGLAREKIRNELPPPENDSIDAWQTFNDAILRTPPLHLSARDDDSNNTRAKLGLYFLLRETVPNLRAGTWRFTSRPDGTDLQPATTPGPHPPTPVSWQSRRHYQCVSAREASSAHPATASLPNHAASTSSAAAQRTRR